MRRLAISVIPLAPCLFVWLFFSHSLLLPDALFHLNTRWFDAQDGDVDVDVVPLT